MKKRILASTLILAITLSLTLPVSAAENNSLPENNESTDMIVSLYTNPDTCHVFESDGTEITDTFLAQHQNNYDAGNYSIIIQDFLNKELSASYPDLDNGAMPRLTMNFDKTTNLSKSYIYMDKTYLYTVGIRVQGTYRDYDSRFQTLGYATRTSFSSGGSSGILSEFYPYNLNIINHEGKQFIRIRLTIGSQTLSHTWNVTANAMNNTLSGYLAP